MAAPPPAGAQITRLAAPGQPGTVLSRRNVRVAAGLALSPLGLMFAAWGLAFGLAALAAPVAGDGAAEGAALVGLVTANVVCVLYLARYGDYLPSRYFLRRSRRAVAGRADAVVDPDDPEAIYVQVIPRRNWGRYMLENAAEVGFLRADPAAGELRYEGDAERWVIPAAAVRSFEVEEFVIGPADGLFGLDRYAVVVLRATVEGRDWEAPVSPRHVAFGRRTYRDRRREAEWLRREIGRLFENPGEPTG